MFHAIEQLIFIVLVIGIFTNQFLGKTGAKNKSLRGVCSILIVIGHAVSVIGTENVKSIVNVGWYIVAIFFFLSGYGLEYSVSAKKDYLNSFWKKRLIKLLVPFFIMHVPYIIVKSLLGWHFSVDDFLYSLLGGCTIVDHSWYVIAAIAMYAVYWIASKLAKDQWQKKIGILLGLLLILTLFECGFTMPDRDWWVISNLAFAVGVLSIRVKVSNIHKAMFGTIGYVLGLLAMPVSLRIYGYSSMIYVVSCNLMSAAVAFLICELVAGKGNRIADFLGDISYEIYLFHGLVILLVQRLDWLNSAAALAAVVVISIIGAYYFHMLNCWIQRRID